MNRISHRGNLFGSFPDLENKQEYITEAIKKAFMVEIDLWEKDGVLLLGHDFGQYEIGFDWLEENKQSLWIHCKNSEALKRMIRGNLHCFFHNTDDYTMTSWGYIWAYPGKPSVGGLCVDVMPERNGSILEYNKNNGFHAVCSDYIGVL